MPRYIEIEFVGTGVVGRTDVLEGEAPGRLRSEGFEPIEIRRAS